MDEANVLVPNDLDLIDEAKAAQIVSQLLLSHSLVQSTQVDVATGVALLDALEDLARNRACLAPADLELVAVESKLLDGGVRVEGGSGGAIKEGDEDAGLFGKDANRLQGTEVDQVQEFINRGIGRKISDVDGAASLVVGGGSCCRCCSDGGILGRITISALNRKGGGRLERGFRDADAKAPSTGPNGAKAS